MIEVEKYLFDQMVGYVNGLSRFVTDVGSKELRKVSEIRARLHDVQKDTKEFTDLLQRKAKSPSSAASAKAMSGLKKPMREILKHAKAIDNGLENGELTYTRFRDLVKTLIKPAKDTLVGIAEKFAPSGMTDEDLKKEIQFASKTKGHRDALNILRKAKQKAEQVEAPADEDDATDEIDNKEIRKQLQGYKNSKSKLPSSLNGRLFQMVEMPIVPFADFRHMSPSFLRKTGLKYSYIAESFPVLERQYLLAFDFAKATEYQGRKKALNQSGLKSRKRAAKHQTMQEHFVLDIIERINAAAPEDFTLVSSHFEFHPTNARIAFAWLLPTRVYRMFERTGDMSKIEWGFPWSRDAVSIL